MRTLFRASKNPQTVKTQFLMKNLRFLTNVGKTACYARHLDLLRNSPLSSIHIHFGGELLVFGASLTSASLSKNYVFDRLKGCAMRTLFLILR